MNNYNLIQAEVKQERTLNRLAMVTGGTAGSDESKAEARKYAASVLAEIERNIGDPKKDMSNCTPHSVAQAMIDAASFGLMINGQQHAHLVKYGNKATLQIGYRAYLAKIKEVYPDADFVVTPVYEGDQLDLWEESGQQQYKLKKNSVFADGEKGFKGILFAVNYTDSGRLVSKVQVVPKSRVDRARKAAKQDFIWSSDYIEKAKAAAIKAACKHLFASIQNMQKMATYDNESNFDVSKPVEKSSALIENLNKSIMAEPDMLPSVDEPEPVKEAEDDSDVIDMMDQEPVVL